MPIYLAEVAPPSIRGQLVGTYDAVLQIGGLLGFWIPYGVQTHLAPTSTQWRIPMALQLVPGGLFLILSLFTVESPRWLRKVGRIDKANENLAYIRKLPVEHEYLVEEMKMIDDQLERERIANGGKTTYWTYFSEIFKDGIRQRLYIGILVFFFQK